MRRILPYLFLLLLTATSCVDNDTYDDNPQGNLEALWRILDEHYCFFEEKGVDWNAVHEKYAVRMNAEMSESQQFEVMTQMISELATAMSTSTRPSTRGATGAGRRTTPPTSATPCCAAISAPTISSQAARTTPSSTTTSATCATSRSSRA